MTINFHIWYYICVKTVSQKKNKLLFFLLNFLLLANANKIVQIDKTIIPYEKFITNKINYFIRRSDLSLRSVQIDNFCPSAITHSGSDNDDVAGQFIEILVEWEVLWEESLNLALFRKLY